MGAWSQQSTYWVVFERNRCFDVCGMDFREDGSNVRLWEGGGEKELEKRNTSLLLVQLVVPRSLRMVEEKEEAKGKHNNQQLLEVHFQFLGHLKPLRQLILIQQGLLKILLGRDEGQTFQQSHQKGQQS